jgi:hypothetical protein
MLIQVVIAMAANNSRLDEPLRLFAYHDFLNKPGIIQAVYRDEYERNLP